MFAKPMMIALSLMILSGATLARDGDSYRNRPQGNDNAKEAITNDKAPTPSELEKLSRSELKKKLEEMDAARKAAPPR
jgi:hypothetical protein